MEKKEYSLQLLENRLVEIEGFLREWGRNNPVVKKHLKTIRINPELKKKKITGVIDENEKL